MDVRREKPLSVGEALELIKWKETTLENATKKVLVGDGYGVAYPSMAGWNGKCQWYFMGKPVSSIWEAVEMVLTPKEFAMVEMAYAYEDMLWQDADDLGGFDEMAEAYAAGVPIEDILA